MFQGVGSVFSQSKQIILLKNWAMRYILSQLMEGNILLFSLYILLSKYISWILTMMIIFLLVDVFGSSSINVTYIRNVWIDVWIRLNRILRWLWLVGKSDSLQVWLMEVWRLQKIMLIRAVIWIRWIHICRNSCRCG